MLLLDMRFQNAVFFPRASEVEASPTPHAIEDKQEKERIKTVRKGCQLHESRFRPEANGLGSIKDGLLYCWRQLVV
jgi:hypothetical protein